MTHTITGLRRIAVAAIGLTALALPALAGPTYSFSLNQTSVSQFPSSGVGTVTLTQNGTNSVNVMVDLKPVGTGAAFGFLNTGGPHTPFTFNLANMNGLSIAFTQPTGGTFTNGGNFSFILNTSGGSAKPYGAFSGAIDINPTSNGSSHAYFGDLAFTLTRTSGLSTSDFISTANSGYAYFAADITDRYGHTGTVASTVRTSSAVPEPASMALLGLGLIGSSLVVSRRRSPAAA